MEKGSILIDAFIRIFLFFHLLIKNPKLVVLKTLIWRRYRKGWFGKRITSFEPDKELLLTRLYLTNWYLKPNLEKLDSDIGSIMAVKNIKYQAIRHGSFDPDGYQIVTSALKRGSKKVWEPIILILEEMSFHFIKVHNIVISMTKDSSGFIRETAILIMEVGNFTIEDKKAVYSYLSKDRNRKVRKRVLDMIFREGKKYMNHFESILDDVFENDEDESIKEMAGWIKCKQANKYGLGTRDLPRTEKR